jgi:uncharacterized protein YndB with AHSA1/START domain
MTDHRARVLRIERTFDAPVERFFEAWTSEEVLRRWLHGMPDWETPTAEVDLRVDRAKSREGRGVSTPLSVENQPTGLNAWLSP